MAHQKFITRIFLGIICCSLSGCGCGDDKNPAFTLDDPTGFYQLTFITDWTGELGAAGQTLIAGQPNQVKIELNGQQVTVTVRVTGTLTLTETRYTTSQTVTVTVPGISENTDISTDTGTYIISGSTITIDSDDPEEDTETAAISSNGNDITIDDDESLLVYRKQS